MTSASVQDRVTSHPAPTTKAKTQARALGVVGAVSAALAVWAVSGPMLGNDLLVQPGSASPQTVGLGAVVGSSLIASLLGWALLAVLERFTSRATTVWTAVAIVVLVLSLAGPFTAGTTTAAIATLALMHLAVGAVLIPSFRHSSRTV